MSGQVSRGSAREYQADEQAGVVGILKNKSNMPDWNTPLSNETVLQINVLEKGKSFCVYDF